MLKTLQPLLLERFSFTLFFSASNKSSKDYIESQDCSSDVMEHAVGDDPRARDIRILRRDAFTNW